MVLDVVAASKQPFTDGAVMLSLPAIGNEKAAEKVLWRGDADEPLTISKSCTLTAPEVGRYEFRAYFIFSFAGKRASTLMRVLYVEVGADAISASNTSFEQIKREEVQKEMQKRGLKGASSEELRQKAPDLLKKLEEINGSIPGAKSLEPKAAGPSTKDPVAIDSAGGENVPAPAAEPAEGVKEADTEGAKPVEPVEPEREKEEAFPVQQPVMETKDGVSVEAPAGAKKKPAASKAPDEGIKEAVPIEEGDNEPEKKPGTPDPDDEATDKVEKDGAAAPADKEPLAAEPEARKLSTSANIYAVYGVIASFTGISDPDSDGYWATYTFYFGIDADAMPGPATVYGRMICETTGQEWWSSSTWSVSGVATDYKYFTFDHTDFAGYITGNTSLDFSVEIWNSTRTTRLARNTNVFNEPVKVDPASSVTVYSVYGEIDSFAGGADADGDGYFETFDFLIGIDADAIPGPATIYGRMRCVTTGQSWWSSSSWTVTGIPTDYHYFSFDETDFAGYISGNTDLDFTVEIWDVTKTTKLAEDTTVFGEPVKADYITPTTYAVYGVVDSFAGTVDADADGYFEAYTFRIGINGDVTPGSVTMYGKMICTNTGQSWWSSTSWTVTGTATDYHYFSFSQDDFPDLTGNTDIDFTVEMWDEAKTTKLAEDITVLGEPVKAEPAWEHVVYGKIDSFTGTSDADDDGYWDAFTFRIGIDANASPGPATIFGKMICTTTGQSWWSSGAWTVTGTSEDWVYVDFSQGDFASLSPGHHDLDFTVEIWDEAKATKLAADTSVIGEPVKLEIPLDVPQYVIHGRMEYRDRNNSPHPIRYALIKVFDEDIIFDDEVGSTYTNAAGDFSITVPNSEANGLDIYLRVYTQSGSGAYAGASSAIATVRNDGGGSSIYFLQSATYTNCTTPDLPITMPIPSGIANEAFSVFDSAVEAFHQTKSKYACEMPLLDVFFEADGTYFSSGSIYLLRLDRWDRDVILHEYGHFIQQTIGFQDGSAGSPDHSWYEDLRYWAGSSPTTRTDAQARNLAFREAWPTFFSISVQFTTLTPDTTYSDTEDTTIDDNLETDTALHLSPGQFHESMNCCALWDIFDNCNHAVDDNDTLGSNTHEMIWRAVSTGTKPDDIIQFWNEWFSQSANAREITRIFLDHRMTFIAQSPTGPSPSNAATGVAVTADLDWSNATNATSYDVYFGTSADALSLLGNTLASSYILPTLECGTTHYWQVVAKDAHAEAEGPVWRFTTVACPPVSPTNCGHSGNTAGSITWTWTDNSSNEQGFRVHNASHTVQWTASANSTSFQETGLSVNTLYTRHAHAYNAEGDSAPSTDATAYTSIESCNGPTFGTITAASIQAASINTPTGLARGSSGIIICNITNSANSGWRPNNDFWTSSGLIANKAYEFTAQSRNGDTDVTAETTSNVKYTLPVPPGITCDKQPSIAQPPGTCFVFTNAAGWGVGGVDHYHYVIDGNPSTNPTGAGETWSTGTVSACPAAGSWYLHVMSHNPEHASGGMMHYGPYIVQQETAELIIEGPGLSSPLISPKGSFTVNVYGENIGTFASIDLEIRFIDPAEHTSDEFVISQTGGDPLFDGYAVALGPGIFADPLGNCDGKRVLATSRSGPDPTVTGRALLLSITYDYRLHWRAPAEILPLIGVVYRITAGNDSLLLDTEDHPIEHEVVEDNLRAWPRIHGDANMDCRVNILDLIFIRNRLGRDVTTGDNWQADVNEDGRINILDLIYARNRLNTTCSGPG
ncbi:MAG TPA: dockerin type I domain-containing protein [Planctomycetota bacterium]|nr:dockerin type I domain-containing protein [Planctomycetota bacterium]